MIGIENHNEEKETEEKQDDLVDLVGYNMVDDVTKTMKHLINQLNIYRDSYYNNQISLVSDREYDELYDRLKWYEDCTGVKLSNSPTQTVGYEVKSELEKIKHSHPMLSLNKTKSVNDLRAFAGDNDCILSLKLDGLTVLLTYENGKLIQAETRGNGEIGEIITHNAKVFENIPLNIAYKEHLEVEGEAIITYDDFNKINDKIDDPDNKYKNPRNLVSGSVRQLDSKIAADRHIKFVVWKVPTQINNINFRLNNSFVHRLLYIEKIGFDIVPFYTFASQTRDSEYLNEMILELKDRAKSMGFPIDGLVMTYDDISYGESLGNTSHHPKHSIAFKFYDETVDTILKNIDWTVGKSGTITPTAVFNPVEIDGTIVERASVHNVSILSELNLCNGDTIEVCKANSIIPQVKNNLSADERRRNGITTTPSVPIICPICGEPTKIVQENLSKILICTNENCKGKLLGKLNHFVSKNAMNINGLSESTLKRFINLGWINSFEDIYLLKYHEYEMRVLLDGFGETSTYNLLRAIEESQQTTLERFIYALCIPLIGQSASKTISRYFDGDFNRFYKEGCVKYFEYEKLDDFGSTMANSIRNYVTKNIGMIGSLSRYLDFEKLITTKNNICLSSLTFVITGSLNHFENRDEAKQKIESLGGKVSGSVSSRTNYLVNNDINSTSSKNKKAKDLGIKIITEEELINMINK